MTVKHTPFSLDNMYAHEVLAQHIKLNGRVSSAITWIALLKQALGLLHAI
jgi:hypothetical protein